MRLTVPPVCRRAFLLLFALSTLVLAGDIDRASAQDEAGGTDGIELKIEPPFAWNRTDRYEPPDFDGFFPDDVEAGKQLDRMLEGKLETSGVDERLALIRRGLRNTTRHRTLVLGSLGNRFIWNKDRQDPRAIELMYHASGSPDGGVSHYALYHGPTVVSGRTPNLVRMLMEQYQSLDLRMQRRIAWGMRTYGDKEHTRKLLLDLLDDHKSLNASVVGAAIDTYQAVFEQLPPDMERFEHVGKWVIAFHRPDLSATHPRAAGILREALETPLRGRPQRLLEFVTRVVDGHETAVVLLQGFGTRTDLTKYLSDRPAYRIDFDESLSPRTLQERRLREFVRHLPDGLPESARPSYTRPPVEATYAFAADEFIAPHYETFFPDDEQAGKTLDEIYDHPTAIAVSDRELLDAFRRGLRRSSHPPNVLFGWISGALGWPSDPRLTEILYQGMDVRAPVKVRKAAIYYGFGLGTTKTRNVLEALYRVYMTPPFDRTTNGNMRSRILWGVRDHADDKHYLATRFEEALRGHRKLSDQAVQLADHAYRQLAGQDPPNADEYATRGVYLVMWQDKYSRSIDESKQRIAGRVGGSRKVIDTRCVRHNGRVAVMAAVRGPGGMKWLVENLQQKPKMTIYFADLLTRELIDQAENDVLRPFEKHVPEE